jgi:hypothetical protein
MPIIATVVLSVLILLEFSSAKAKEPDRTVNCSPYSFAGNVIIC